MTEKGNGDLYRVSEVRPTVPVRENPENPDAKTPAEQNRTHEE